MKRHILYCQPIFTPDKVRLRRNINSILSIGEYLKQNPVDDIEITFAFGGCCFDGVNWDNVIDTIKAILPEQAKIYRYDQNYGKAFIINDMYAKLKHIDFDAILSVDSDIIFTLSDRQIFQRLYAASVFISEKRKKEWGIIALNQYDQCCHLKNCYDNIISFNTRVAECNYEEQIVHPDPDHPSGIAGGCLFINRKMWDAVGGYRILGVYAGDDAYILIDCSKSGYTNNLMHSLGVSHPAENDEYSQWKYKVAHRDTDGKIKHDISKQINEANDFWEGRINAKN